MAKKTEAAEAVAPGSEPVAVAKCMPAVDPKNPGKVPPEHIEANLHMLKHWKRRNLRGEGNVHLCAVCGWACKPATDAAGNVAKPERLVCGYAGDEHSGVVPPTSPEVAKDL